MTLRTEPGLHQRQAKADKPFFVWVNFTHMHLRTTSSREQRAGGPLAERVPRRDDRPRQELGHGPPGLDAPASRQHVHHVSTDNGHT